MLQSICADELAGRLSAACQVIALAPTRRGRSDATIPV